MNQCKPFLADLPNDFKTVDDFKLYVLNGLHLGYTELRTFAHPGPEDTDSDMSAAIRSLLGIPETDDDEIDGGPYHTFQLIVNDRVLFAAFFMASERGGKFTGREFVVGIGEAGDWDDPDEVWTPAGGKLLATKSGEAEGGDPWPALMDLYVTHL